MGTLRSLLLSSFDVLSCLAVLSFFYSGGTLDIKMPLNPLCETLRVGVACALRLRQSRRRAKRGVSKTERVGKASA